MADVKLLPPDVELETKRVLKQLASLIEHWQNSKVLLVDTK